MQPYSINKYYKLFLLKKNLRIDLNLSILIVKVDNFDNTFVEEDDIAEMNRDESRKPVKLGEIHRELFALGKFSNVCKRKTYSIIILICS